MEIRQLSIFLENRLGRLAEVTAVLGEAKIDILAISVADTADFGILRLLVDDVDKAVAALKAKSIVCTVNPVTVVSVNGVPGGLAAILKVINEKALNIEYMYAIAQTTSANPLMVFRFADPAAAKTALEAAGATLLGADALR